MNWHFCIDNPEKLALDCCGASMSKGNGHGCSTGRGHGLIYGCTNGSGYGGGWSFRVRIGNDWGDGDEGTGDGNGRSRCWTDGCSPGEW